MNKPKSRPKSTFQLVSDFTPTGDQPQAIEKLVTGLRAGLKHQALLGVTGSGKTFTMANVIAQINRPTLVISHNKTLAAQLYQEYKAFFPHNAVEYFISYYDYYQPEAYIPQTDTYIEKETAINEEIDRLRLSATTSLLTRRDVIVVASVSCIYNLGSPVEYGRQIIKLRSAMRLRREDLFKRLTGLHYQRTDWEFKRASFRVKGDTIDIWPSHEEQALRLEFLDEKLVKINQFNPLTGKASEGKTNLPTAVIYPAKHYLTTPGRLEKALEQIREDLETRLKELREIGKNLEAYRLEQRTNYDLEMIKEIGYCNGIENYSRYFDGRKTGEPPFTLLDYFTTPTMETPHWLLITDESHITIPQLQGMYRGDLSRKQTLIDYGFRLPSALDNRPLRFEEFLARVPQVIYASATPARWEIEQAKKSGIVEQLIRPTGILDPQIEIRGSSGQIENLICEIKNRISQGERTLVTTITKRIAEDLAEYLAEQGIKVHYLHADVETLERTDILEDLRLGRYDVVVGINLLREGLDLPEVSLIVILDADKEGFLRSETSLIQVMGRAARHINGKVIMYADTVTGSMRRAIDEIDRRRKIQEEYNRRHKITPRMIVKPVRQPLRERSKTDKISKISEVSENSENSEVSKVSKISIKALEREMREAAKMLDFEKAAFLRDKIRELTKE